MKASRVDWSSYVAVGAIDSLVSVLGVISALTVEPTVSKFVVIAAALAATSSTGIALFFAFYLTTTWESRSDQVVPSRSIASHALAKAAVALFTAMATGILVVLPFLAFTLYEATVVSVLAGLTSLIPIGWFQEAKNAKRRKRLETALKTVSIGLAALAVARLIGILIETLAKP
jgi:signal transduction histidine kinase